jgi:hypothetical protein
MTRIIAVFLFNLIITGLWAQFPVNTDTTVTKPTKVEVFNADNYFSRESKPTDIKNAVKVNPLLIINGDIPFYYERRLGQAVSMEIAAGITLRDYFAELISEDFSFESDNRIGKTGYSLHGAFRYYPSKYYSAIEGFYFSPNIRFRSYSALVNPCPNQVIIPSFKEYKKNTDYMITIGHQDLDGFDEDVVIDYYLGFGIRKRVYNEFLCTDLSGNKYEITETKDLEKIRPLFVMGIKLGLGFK